MDCLFFKSDPLVNMVAAFRRLFRSAVVRTSPDAIKIEAAEADDLFQATINMDVFTHFECFDVDIFGVDVETVEDALRMAPTNTVISVTYDENVGQYVTLTYEINLVDQDFRIGSFLFDQQNPDQMGFHYVSLQAGVAQVGVVAMRQFSASTMVANMVIPMLAFKQLMDALLVANDMISVDASKSKITLASSDGAFSKIYCSKSCTSGEETVVIVNSDFHRKFSFARVKNLIDVIPPSNIVQLNFLADGSLIFNIVCQNFGTFGYQITAIE